MEMDLALNNLKRLICYRTQTNKHSNSEFKAAPVKQPNVVSSNYPALC